jgi:hypothetical protein
MDASQIVDDVIRILKIGGALGQDPYQGQLFELCRAAHDGNHTAGSARPRLTGDGLSDVIRERWPDAERHRQRIDQLSTIWRAWLYSFSRR